MPRIIRRIGNIPVCRTLRARDFGRPAEAGARQSSIGFDFDANSLYNHAFSARGVRKNGSRVRFSMYAVIKTGGKQYKVAVGEKLKVGESIKFGTPLVSGASVKATVVSHGRHAKVTIFKMRRRKHYQKHGGHRQNYTELRIDAINA